MQFASVNSVDAFLRFGNPLCLDLFHTLFIQTFPKDVDQHSALTGAEANNFLLNRCKAHAVND